MPDRKVKVFISMPFTGKPFETVVQERKDLHALTDSYGLELPEQFIGYQFSDDFKTKDYDPTFILAKDKKCIKESDIVVADFSSLSVGVSAEVTIAKELFDKRVIGVIPNPEMQKHTWLRFYCDHFVSTFEEAFELIQVKYAGINHTEHVDKRQYDSIAVEYQLVEATPIQKYVYDPNARKELELGKGKAVGVFHCASGHRARIAAEAGASTILGLDSSFRQISLAREIELDKKQGIEYLVLNAYSRDFEHELPAAYLGELDVVLGFFLIDHAQTKPELDTLAQNIYKSLKLGGTFVAMLDDADATVPTDPKHGVAIEPLTKERGDGSQRKIVIYQNMKDGEDRPVLHFFNFEWSRDTVKAVFEAAGFKDCQFKDPFVLPEGKERLGAEFWAKYESNPDNVLLICTK